MLKRFDASKEYFFAEGCFINELSNDALDTAVSIAQARVEPGNTTRWHQLHNTIERYVILSGTGLVEVGDNAPREVGPGDCVIIPARVRQRITNCGNTDLIFLAICSPRFTVECYEDLDQA